MLTTVSLISVGLTVFRRSGIDILLEKLKIPFLISKSIGHRLDTHHLAPVFGVIFMDWDAFLVVFLFWTENVIIGFFNILKMAVAPPDATGKWGPKYKIIPFFCVHYGMFALVHGFIIFAIFGSVFENDDSLPEFLLLIIP